MPVVRPTLGPALLVVGLALAGLLVGAQGSSASGERPSAALPERAPSQALTCHESGCDTLLVIEPGVFIPYDDHGVPQRP